MAILEILSKELSGDLNQHSFTEMMKKLIVLESDLTKPRLGLNDEDYHHITNEVTLVIHNGSNVNHVLSYNGKIQNSNNLRYYI